MAETVLRKRAPCYGELRPPAVAEETPAVRVFESCKIVSRISKVAVSTPLAALLVSGGFYRGSHPAKPLRQKNVSVEAVVEPNGDDAV